MEPRRSVEKFDAGRWTKQPGQDGKTYLVSIKLNGVEASFTVAQSVSDSAFATESPALARWPTDKDWEALLKLKITEAVGQGFLDNWPPSETIALPIIVSQQVDDLFAEARRRGMV